VCWDVFPFKRKKQLDWIQGVTPRKRPSRRILPALSAWLVGGGIIVAAAIWLPPINFASWTAPVDWLNSEYFRLCHSGGGWNCVVDGDTFHYHFTRIRIADIDAPETHPPRCKREARLGQRATQRLQELLNQGPFTMHAIDRDEDQYGRKLRIVMRGGDSLGLQLVNEGLARQWIGRRQPWC
jgi:endonuclease YncB( thermonuclease family)